MAEPRGQSALFQVHLHQLDAQKWSAAGAPMLWSVVCEASAEGWAGLACGKAGIHQRRQHCERMRMRVSMWACGVLTMSETYLVTRPTIRRRARRVAGVIYDAFGIRRKKRHQMNKPPARAVALVSAAPTGVDTVSIKRRTAQGLSLIHI